MTGELILELAAFPAGITERDDPLRRPTLFGDRPKDVDRPRHREQLSVRPGHLERVLSTPVGGMKDETSPWLDRAAVVDGAVRRLAGVQVELLEKRPETQPGALVADADADGTVLVVNAKGNDGALESRVGHAGHRQQQLAGKERRAVHGRT